MEQVIAVIDISMENTIHCSISYSRDYLTKVIVQFPCFFLSFIPVNSFFPILFSLFLYWTLSFSSLPDNYGLKRCVVSQEADLPILPK